MAVARLCSAISMYPEGRTQVRGSTTSGQVAQGLRRTWVLSGAGPDLPIWDTTWSTGERELVLGSLDPLPELPQSVANLMGRRRATVEDHQAGVLRMTVRLVLPDQDAWPRFKSCSLDQLRGASGSAHIDELGVSGIARIGTKADLLGESGRNRNELVGLMRADLQEAPAVLYAASRVLPVLRVTGLSACHL